MDEHCFVVSAYQDSPFLASCIESLKAQTLPTKITLATSTPSLFLEKTAAEFGLELIINPHQGGIASDWNFALAASKSKWVTLVHQDDTYDPGFAAAAVKTFQAHPDCAMHFTGATEMTPAGQQHFSLNQGIKNTLLLPFFLQNPMRAKWLKHLVLAFGNPICCPSVTYNKEKLSTFQFNPQYSYVLDWAAWVEIFSQPWPIAFTRQALVTHRIHPGSATVNELKKGASQKEEKAMLEKFWGKHFTNFLYFFYRFAHSNHKT